MRYGGRVRRRRARLYGANLDAALRPDNKSPTINACPVRPSRQGWRIRGSGGRAVFTESHRRAALALVELALAEDLGERGDVTSRATIPADRAGSATLVARKAGVLAGLPVVALLVETHGGGSALEPFYADGQALRPGDRIATLRGRVRAILGVERVALNFLQHLCGVATLTRQYVDATSGLPARVLDTRKTTPGWRLLEKYAVACGGGTNHRVGLYDGVLIKDNHLAAQEPVERAVELAITAARAFAPDLPVEIEVDTLEQLDRALPLKPEIVLLDNMPPETLREAVRRRDAVSPSTLLEASGGVNLTTIRAIAETGVDRISVGAITHSAVALDIGLDYDS